MADTTLEYNFQQCHMAVLAQEALAAQLQATVARQAEQVADLRKRLDALAHEAQVTLTVPPPPDSEVVVPPVPPEPQPAPQVQPKRVDPSERPDHVSVSTTQPVPPSVPRTPSRSGRSSGEAKE